MTLLADPTLKDEAIVLRWFPVTDTSRIVVWFTKRYGKISTLIKGSQRPKSWMLGQYDHFYTCELVFYKKAKEDLHQIRECAVLQQRPNFRLNWRAAAGASFVADLLYRITPPLAASPELFRLGSETLDCLATRELNPVLLFWVELKIWTDLGLEPDLSIDGSEGLLFDYAAGRLVSEDSAGSSPTPRGKLTPGVCSLLRRLAGATKPQQAARLQLHPAQIRELSAHFDAFSKWHVDLSLPSRALALQLMTF